MADTAIQDPSDVHLIVHTVAAGALGTELACVHVFPLEREGYLQVRSTVGWEVARWPRTKLTTESDLAETSSEPFKALWIGLSVCRQADDVAVRILVHFAVPGLHSLGCTDLLADAGRDGWCK